MITVSDLRDFFFPRWCPACGAKLLHVENPLCLGCMAGLPKVHLGNTPGNEMEQMFWGIIPIERASTLYLYTKGGGVAQILYAMKYHGRKDICRQMGMLLADELLPSGFFHDIDGLVPVPLHPKRLRKRGYNQSEQLAQGISVRTDIPVYPHVISRVHNNQTQTHKSVYERWVNTETLFRTTPETLRLAGKHLLLVDDVLTTGATLSACAEALLKSVDVRIRILTQAWAKLNAF